MNFREILEDKIKETNQIIENYLPHGDCGQAELLRAVNYSVLAGGKRIRPILLRESYRLFGGDSALESGLVNPFMAALEMIHTYSLVHDDLPAMDNDLLRRGKPTTHAAFGEAMAILAGDGLLNYAFETMNSVYQRVERNVDIYERIMRATFVIAQKAGIYGMIGGQALDIRNDAGHEPDLSELETIYCLKTSALLQAAMTAGAILAGAENKDVLDMEKCGEYVGLAFQIRDDILDETSTNEQLGKPVHSDEKNSKLTYARIKGVEYAKNEVDRISLLAAEIIKSKGGEDSFLAGLVSYLTVRDN